MHDLKIYELFENASKLRKRIPDAGFQFRACQHAFTNFVINIGLGNSLSMLPAYAFMNGENWRSAVLEAMKEAGTGDPKHPDVISRATKCFEQNSKLPDAFRVEHFYDAAKNVSARFVWRDKNLNHDSLHSLLKSLVIHAWTAFETLATDLLRMCHKHHREYFEPDAEFIRKGLKSRDMMRSAYKKAFLKENASILNPLNDININGLAHLRNMIVHSAGRVDEVFRLECSDDGFQAWAALEEGKEFPFTGGLVRQYINLGIDSGNDLLCAVNDWLLERRAEHER